MPALINAYLLSTTLYPFLPTCHIKSYYGTIYLKYCKYIMLALLKYQCYIYHIPGKFGESYMICQTKTIQTSYNNLLADLLIHHTFFCQMLEKSPFTNLSHYMVVNIPNISLDQCYHSNVGKFWSGKKLEKLVDSKSANRISFNYKLYMAYPPVGSN